MSGCRTRRSRSAPRSASCRRSRFFWRVFTARVPIVDLRTFSDRNFAVGCLLQFCVGIGLYGLTYVYPRYLAEVRGYSAMMIGETMFVSGVTQFLMAPIIGRLMLSFDLRYIIVFGLVTFAAGSYQMTWITRDYDFYELLLPQILRGIGMMCAMVPTNNIALGTLAPERVKNASGLFNLMRNLGGALGLAVINQMLNERTDLHISRLQDRVTWGNTTAVETLNMLTQRAQGMGDAALMAMKQLSQIVHRQAAGHELWRRLLHAGAVLSGLEPACRAPEKTGIDGGRRRRALGGRVRPRGFISVRLFTLMSVTYVIANQRR